MMANTIPITPSAPLPHPSLAQDSLLHVLRLIRSENVGPVTFFQLIKRYRSAEKALNALPMLALRGGARRNITVCSVEKASQEIEATHKAGASFILYGQPHYPSLLHHIPDAPPVLVVKGHPHLLDNKPLLAMVGSRNASGNACRFAAALAKSLTEAGYNVVSGLARGIDTYAHQGALAGGTIGVIAGGIDHIYPQENAALFEQMTAQGALVTESPYGTAPQHRHFPARNRIIAGMARGVIVVEAAAKSGSLITAKFALDYHRDIFAVPGFPLDPRAAGTNQLIQQGAMLVGSAHDIIDALYNRPHYLSDSYHRPAYFSQTAPEEEEEGTLDVERAMLLNLLHSTPLMVEDILVMTDLPPRIVNVLLLELELAGMITRHNGGSISRRYE
jgi:DNA processing protein